MVGEALLAHKFRVMRLYRHHLKNMMSWEIHREAKIFEQFEAIRAEFEKNRNVVSAINRSDDAPRWSDD